MAVCIHTYLSVYLSIDRSFRLFNFKCHFTSTASLAWLIHYCLVIPPPPKTRRKPMFTLRERERSSASSGSSCGALRWLHHLLRHGPARGAQQPRLMTQKQNEPSTKRMQRKHKVMHFLCTWPKFSKPSFWTTSEIRIGRFHFKRLVTEVRGGCSCV